MPVTYEDFAKYADDYGRTQGRITPQEEARNRGYIGQGLAGIARGVASGVARPVRALSVIPGVRTVAEPLAEGIENLAPYPSGGTLEAGVESGVSSVVTGGLTAAGIAATGGAVTPLALGAATGAQYFAAETAQSRQRLEQMNTALSAAGQPPLTTGEIYTISATRGLIEGGGEAVSNFLIGTRFLGGQAAQTVKAALASRLPGVVGRSLREAAFIGAQELPTEAAQAAGQSAVERGILGPGRVQALEAAGQPVAEPPGQAAAASVGPAAVASALFGGVAGVAARPGPLRPTGEATAKVGEPPAESQGPLPGVQTAASDIGRTGVAVGLEAVPPTPTGAPTAQEAADRFSAQARAGVQATPSPLASDAPPPVSTAPVSPTRALLPFDQGVPPDATAQIATLPQEVIAEASSLPPDELQARIRQVDTILANRQYAGGQAEDLAPFLARRALYQQRLQEQAGQYRVRPLPFALPAGLGSTPPQAPSGVAGFLPPGPAPLQTQQQRAGFEAGTTAPAEGDIASGDITAPAAPLPSALEAGLARRDLGPVPAPSQALLARRREAFDFLQAGQAPRRHIRGLSREEAVDALLTVAIDTPQQFFDNLATPAGRQGYLRTLTQAGFPRHEAQELLNRTAALVTEQVQEVREILPPDTPATPAIQEVVPPDVPTVSPEGAGTAPPPGDEEAASTETPTGAALPGRASVVRTEENRVAKELGLPYLETQLVIEELGGARNSFQADFPADKQPRVTRRGGQGIDQAAEARLIQMLNDPQFERLLDDTDASRGAPLRDAEGDVLSGNLRDEFLRRVYQQGGPLADQLRAFVRDRAESLGINPVGVESFQQPVIRRVLTTPLTAEQTVRFAEEANVSDVSRIDPVSAALQDARRLTPEILDRLQVSPSGVLDLRSAANDAFRRDLKQSVFPGNIESNALFDRDGNLNDEGVQRAQRAIFAAGYGADVEALTRLANSAEEARRILSGALQKKAGVYAILANDIQAERAHPLHLGPQILEGANFLNRLEKGESARDRLNQTGLFGDEVAEISPEGKVFLLLVDSPFYRRSGAKIQALLQTYHDLVRRLGDPRQTTTETQDVPSQAELLEAADAILQGGSPNAPQSPPARDAELFGRAVPPSRQPRRGGPVPRTGLLEQSGGTPAAAREPASTVQQSAAVESEQQPGAAAAAAVPPAAGESQLAARRPLTGAQIREVRGLLGLEGFSPGEVRLVTAQLRNEALSQGAFTDLARERLQARQAGEGGPAGQLQLATAGPAGLGPVTVAEAQRAFPTQPVTQRPDGVIEVAMPRQGYVLELHNVNQITPTTQELELGYGQQVLSPTQQVTGRATALGQGVFRIEITPERTTTTLLHEGEHFFEDAGLLNDRDIATLNRTLTRRGQEPTAEHRAELVGSLLASRALRGGIPGQSTLAGIVRKAQQLLDRLLRALGIRTTGQVLRQIESGQVFAREAAPQGQGQGRLQVVEEDVNAFRPPYQHEGLFTPVTMKSLLEYNSFSQAWSPTQIAYFQQRNDADAAFFPKVTVPTKVTDEAAGAILRQWLEEPGTLGAFLERLKRSLTRTAELPAGLRTEQQRALQMLSEMQWEAAFRLQQDGTLAPDEFAAFEARWEQAHSVTRVDMNARSEAGRALRQLQELTPVSAFQDKWRRVHELYSAGKIPQKDLEAFKAELQRLFAAGDLDALRQMDPTPPTLKNLFWELYYASLYNIATWSTNLWSTEGHMLFQRGLVEPLAAGVDRAFSRIGHREQAIYANTALKTFREGLGRLPQTFRSFWWLWRNDPRAKDIAPFHQQDTLTQREMTQQAGGWARAVYPAWHPKAGQAIDWMRRLAPAVTLTSRALNAMDVALREQAFDSRMAVLAGEAAQRELGRRNRQWELGWQQHQVRTQGPAFQEAFNESKVLTFHDQTSLLAQLLLSGRKIPGLGFFVQLLFPFANTPDRLLARGLELLPGPAALNFARKAIRLDGWLPTLNREAFTPEASLLMAKQMIGTLMAASLYAAWSQGLITGGVPEDPEDREAFFRQGKVPYSLRVGDTWYSWRRFEPMSLPLAIASSAFEAMDRLTRRQERQGTASTDITEQGLALAAVVAQSVATNILDSSYFAGAAQFLQSTQRGRETGDIPKGVLRQLATMVVPWGGIQRAAIRAVDSLGVVPGTTAGQTVVRQPEGLLEHIDMLLLPGPYLGGGPQPRLDVFGRPQFRRTSFLGELLPGVPPVERGYAVDGGVEAALARTGYAPGQPARLDPATGKAISPEQRRRLTELRGPLLQQRLESLVNSAGFDRLPLDAQRKALQAAASAAGKEARARLRAESLAGVGR